MQRTIATLPDSVTELCLVRVGLQVRKWTAYSHVARLAKAMDRASKEAINTGVGLLHSDRFTVSRRHFGVLQYWRSFADLEQWSHRPPHSEWWREATSRIRTKGDFGIYHETFLVPRAAVESIYVNCDPVGLSAFGTIGEPVGPMTTSRDRLGLRTPKL